MESISKLALDLGYLHIPNDMIIEIDDIEYLLYSVSVNDDEDAIYAKKIIKNATGEDDLIDISDLNEKNRN